MSTPDSARSAGGDSDGVQRAVAQPVSPEAAADSSPAGDPLADGPPDELGDHYVPL